MVFQISKYVLNYVKLYTLLFYWSEVCSLLPEPHVIEWATLADDCIIQLLLKGTKNHVVLFVFLSTIIVKMFHLVPAAEFTNALYKVEYLVLLCFVVYYLYKISEHNQPYRSFSTFQKWRHFLLLRKYVLIF